MFRGRGKHGVQKSIHLLLSHRLLGSVHPGCRFRRRCFRGVHPPLHPALFDLLLDLGHIYGGKAEPLNDAVDLAGVLRPRHDVGQSIRGVPVLQYTVEDAVLFCLPAKELKVAVLDGKHLQLLAAAEHIGQAGLARRLFLLTQDGIDQNGKLFGPGAGQPDRNLTCFQRHPHDLLCRVA